MKPFTFIKASLLIAGLSGIVWALDAGLSTSATPHCTNTVVFNAQGQSKLELQCHQVPKQSWLSWFQGQSRSTQFHFIDLLELLNGISASKKPE